MPGKAKQILKDLKTGAIYESLYAAGKVIGPAEYAAGTAKNPDGKIKMDQHVWFAIHRDKENAGRFERSLDGGQTFQAFPFTPSKRKSAAERKAIAEAKALKNGGGNGVPANETQAQKVARLKAELAMLTETPEQKIARLQREIAQAESTPAVEATAAAVSEDSAQPAPPAKLAGGMKVVKTG